ncbi:TPA: hypothetical protein ACG1DY_005033 [Escherichia coli]
MVMTMFNHENYCYKCLSVHPIIAKCIELPEPENPLDELMEGWKIKTGIYQFYKYD